MEYLDREGEALQERRTFLNTTTFSALAEPHRLHILELLIQQPLTVGEIATRLEIRQPQASKHLKVLSNAGLIEVKAIANRRVCSVRAEPLQEIDQWLVRYRQLWEARYDRLDGFLRQIQSQQPQGTSDPATSPSNPPEDPDSPGEPGY